MSRVTITELKRNTTAKAVDANATLDSFDSATADINGDNIAEEGLDRRPIKKGAITPSRGRAKFESNPNTSLNTSSFKVEPDVSGNMMVCGPVNYTRQGGDELIIRASAQLALLGASDPVFLRIAYSTDYSPSTTVGTWTAMNKTRRPFKYASSGDSYTSWAVATRFIEGGDSFSESGLYFGIEIDTNRQTVELSYIRLFTTLYAK